MRGVTEHAERSFWVFIAHLLSWTLLASPFLIFLWATQSAESDAKKRPSTATAQSSSSKSAGRGELDYEATESARIWEQDRADYLESKRETREALERESRRGDFDCEDFDSQADAEAYFDEHPADRDWLDGDDVGLACEWGT